MKLGCALALAGALLVVAGASASPPRAVRFIPLLHAERQLPVKYPETEQTQVAGVAVVARTANEATGLNFLLPQAARAMIGRIDFNRRVALAVYVTAPTAGYEATVSQVSFARVGKISQWCIRATIAVPTNRPRTGYVWAQTHVVTVPAVKPSVGLPRTPRNWVLRDQDGKLLNVSRAEGSSFSPNRRPRQTAIAKACPR